jgi:uncharacterized lipoprotein YmbA
MRRGLVIAAVLCLGACASKEPPPLLLTLPSSAMQAAPAADRAASAVPQRTLLLRRVGLPEYLLSRRVRFRDSASSLADWPHTWWAERLEVGVTREMTEALRARLPGWTVCEGSCPDGAAGEVVLRIDFQALDFVRGTSGPARLQALALADAGSGDATLWRAEQRFVIDATADTPRAHASAIGDAVRAVADALASRLRATPVARTPGARAAKDAPS